MSLDTFTQWHMPVWDYLTFSRKESLVRVTCCHFITICTSDFQVVKLLSSMLSLESQCHINWPPALPASHIVCICLSLQHSSKAKWFDNVRRAQKMRTNVSNQTLPSSHKEVSFYCWHKWLAKRKAKNSTFVFLNQGHNLKELPWPKWIPTSHKQGTYFTVRVKSPEEFSSFISEQRKASYNSSIHHLGFGLQVVQNVYFR
jgi:hypothetical protein